MTDTSHRERNIVTVHRFNAAMAEAGYPLVRLVVGTADGNIYQGWSQPAPPAIVWQALWLAKAGEPHPCWSCWEIANRADPLGPDHEQGRYASDCVTGRRGGCHFPDGPSVPPKELLRGRDR